MIARSSFRATGRGRTVLLALMLLGACHGGCEKRSASLAPSADAAADELSDARAPTADAIAFDGPSNDAEAALDATDASSAAAARGGSSELVWTRHCPKEMVNVADRFCVDRFEDTLVDDQTGARLSPHYPPEPGLPLRMFDKWQEARLTQGPPSARTILLPGLPDVERKEDFVPRAVSVRGVLPQGYISGRVAAEACARAKKRLCTHEEWTFACRGESQTKYPYGAEYRAGVCNVFRSSHPAEKLHGNASIGHSDPRLGLMADSDGPLLRPTGSTKTCASRWGKDAIYDMVGNQDEWIDDPDGTFVGGFYSRSTKEGCDSIVTVHPLLHWDYSIGMRCCK